MHGILLQARLDAATGEIERIVALQGRILGASAEEMSAASDAVVQALGSEVMKRAHASSRCLRECPVLVTLEDGTLAEGIADLAFEEAIGGERWWTVVDFKTDAEIQGHLPRYRAQLEIYMRGISRSTGLKTRGILLWV